MRLTKNEILYATMRRKGLTLKMIGDALKISIALVSMALSEQRPKQAERVAKFIRSYKPNGKQ